MIKYRDFMKEVKSNHCVGIWGQIVYKVLPLWRKSQHILRTSKWFAILMIIWTTDSDHKEGHSSKHNQKLYFWSLVVKYQTYKNLNKSDMVLTKVCYVISNITNSCIYGCYPFFTLSFFLMPSFMFVLCWK